MHFPTFFTSLLSSKKPTVPRISSKSGLLLDQGRPQFAIYTSSPPVFLSSLYLLPPTPLCLVYLFSLQIVESSSPFTLHLKSNSSMDLELFCSSRAQGHVGSVTLNSSLWVWCS